MPEHVTEQSLSGAARPRLLDVARDAIRRRHYSYRTDETYRRVRSGEREGAR